jgi:hypothetical protein
MKQLIDEVLMKSIFQPVLSMIAVSLLAGSVYAADDTRPGDPNSPAASQTNPSNSQTNPSNSQSTPGNSQSTPRNSQSQPGDSQTNPGTASQSTDPSANPKDREYQAAVKRCESMQQADQRKCLDTAKKKFGQM